MFELEALKIDLNNLIDGMTILTDTLTENEKECLRMLCRCLSVIDRIVPINELEVTK